MDIMGKIVGKMEQIIFMANPSSVPGLRTVYVCQPPRYRGGETVVPLSSVPEWASGAAAGDNMCL